MKKLTALLLALCLLLSLCACGGKAEESMPAETVLETVSPVETVSETPTVIASGYCGAETNPGGEESVSWVLEIDGTLTISGKGAMKDFEIVRNKKTDTHTVYTPWTSETGDAACEVTRVVVENGITRIGNGAFARCGKITDAELPGSLVEIGDDAFLCAWALTNINIPDGVTTIGEYAFYGAPLDELILPDSVTKLGEYAFA